LGFRIL